MAPASAGVFVSAPANMPAVRVRGKRKTAYNPTVSAVLKSNISKIKPLSRNPLRRNDAKNPGPLLSPMV
jgi:hypothetical protein